MKMITLRNPATKRETSFWDGRANMRTIADALAKLQELKALADDGQAEIRAVSLRLPDRSIVATVAVCPREEFPSWRIMMPSAAYFTAKDILGARNTYQVSHLDGAIADADGYVQLVDGSPLRAVELKPVRLRERLTPRQEEILRFVIAFLKAEEQCYRPVHEESLPGVVALDYAAVAELGAVGLPSLKAIEGYIVERYEEKQVPDRSRQTIANALAVCGLRLPRSGRLAHPQSRRK